MICPITSASPVTTANLKIITERFNKLKTDIINSSAKIISITKALEISNQKISSLENELNNIKKSIHVNDEIVASKFEKVKEQTKKLREIEDRSRRNNLRITGIKESEHESWEKSELKVLKLFEETVEIKNVKIERVHRTGPRDAKKNRTFILKHLNYKDKIVVMKRFVRLKGMNIYIHEDFCYETVPMRKDLRDKMLRERKQGKYAFISDKLIIREWAEKKIDAKNRQV
ncbi:uncharacterized protein LOC136074561 [Hydra vulgaris]|uniref:Uncharacterized protein LOC136074561 n=1 Tax=Hydra vulgaris TaxID=6087 RepID=A0ABM4B2H6_HYDVU